MGCRLHAVTRLAEELSCPDLTDLRVGGLFCWLLISTSFGPFLDRRSCACRNNSRPSQPRSSRCSSSSTCSPDRRRCDLVARQRRLFPVFLLKRWTLSTPIRRRNATLNAYRIALRCPSHSSSRTGRGTAS